MRIQKEKTSSNSNAVSMITKISDERIVMVRFLKQNEQWYGTK